VRKVDSNSLLVGMQYQQNLKNQLLEHPLDYQDIDEITRMKRRLEEDRSFYSNLKKSNEKSSYLGDLLLQVVEQNLERFNHRLLEMVKVIELEVTGRREQESEHGVYETQIVSNPTDLLIYSQKVKEIQSLYTGSNKQTFANLTAVLDPVATMTREQRRDNFGTLASEVDAIVTKHETDLAVFENKIADGQDLSPDDRKEMERLVALARCGVNAFQTGLDIPGAYLKRQHWFDRGKVDRSVIDRLAAMQDSVNKLDIKLNLLVIPKAEADIARIDTNLAKIDAQINSIPMSRTTYEALKKQLTIVDKCMEAGRDGIVGDTRRDSENISSSLLTANIATTPESIDAWDELDPDERNILQGLDVVGNPIDFYSDCEGNKTRLVNVAIKYLEVLNPYLMSSGGDVQGYLETSFVTAWLINNYLGPKVKGMQTTLENNKPLISADLDPQIGSFETEVAANEAKDYSHLGDIVTSTNAITTYISANTILTDDQKTRLEGFKTRLEKHIKDLIENQYAEIQNATDALIGRLKTGADLNYKITGTELASINTELDVLQTQLTDLDGNLNTLNILGYDEKRAEVQSFIELVWDDIMNINILKTKNDPEIRIQELRQHYSEIKSILDDDKSGTPPTADLSEGNLTKLETINDKMQVVFDEFDPVTIDLLPNGLQKGLNAGKLAMETSQSIYRYYDESEVTLPNFFNPTPLVNFTDYATFKANIETLTNSLKTVKDQKTALKTPGFKTTFDLHLDAISKEYQDTLTWAKHTMDKRIGDTTCNFTPDQISALNNLFGISAPIPEDPFADGEEIIELVDPDGEPGDGGGAI